MCLQYGIQHNINTDDSVVEKALLVQVVGVSTHNGIHVIQASDTWSNGGASQRVGPCHSFWPDKAFYLNPGISSFVLL